MTPRMFDTWPRACWQDVRELATRTKQHEHENAALKKADAKLQAKVHTLQQRADLTQALRGLNMDELHALTRSSTEVAR